MGLRTRSHFTYLAKAIVAYSFVGQIPDDQHLAGKSHHLRMYTVGKSSVKVHSCQVQVAKPVVSVDIAHNGECHWKFVVGAHMKDHLTYEIAENLDIVGTGS